MMLGFQLRDMMIERLMKGDAQQIWLSEKINAELFPERYKMLLPPYVHTQSLIENLHTHLGIYSREMSSLSESEDVQAALQAVLERDASSCTAIDLVALYEQSCEANAGLQDFADTIKQHEQIGRELQKLTEVRNAELEDYNFTDEVSDFVAREANLNETIIDYVRKFCAVFIRQRIVQRVAQEQKAHADAAKAQEADKFFEALMQEEHKVPV